MSSFKDQTEPITTEDGITVTAWREFSHTLKDGWLYAEIETVRHGHYRPAASAPHVVA